MQKSSKGNVYIYAVFILVMATIVLLLQQFLSAALPGQSGRSGNEIRISQFSFGFLPDSIELQQGEAVILAVKSDGGDHNFDIDQYGIHEKVKHGQTVRIPLTASLPGEFFYYDSLPGHNQSGEHGLLVVRP